MLNPEIDSRAGMMPWASRVWTLEGAEQGQKCGEREGDKIEDTGGTWRRRKLALASYLNAGASSSTPGAQGEAPPGFARLKCLWRFCTC